MSTILKALKRSEASRPRDSSLPLGPMTGGVATGRRGAAPWLAAAALILAGSAAWWWAEHRSATGPGGSADAQRRIAEVSLPARPADAESESRPEEFASSVAGTQTPDTNEPDSSSDPAERDPAGSSSRADAQRGEADSPDPTDADEGSGVAELADAAPEPAPDAGRPDAAPEQNLDRFALLPRFRDLPAARRDSLPKLVLNAHVHAAEPGQRFVLINLSRYGEGDRVAGGLTVAAIFPGGVVLEDDHGRFVLPRP